MPTSSACPLERPQSEPKKQSTNIKNFVHSCHKQKRAKTADGRRYQFKYKGQLPVRPYEPTTHHPLMGVSTHQAMNILVNAAQGFDFPTWSPVVPHYLPKKKKTKRVLFLGDPTIYAIFGKLFLCLCVQFSS